MTIPHSLAELEAAFVKYRDGGLGKAQALAEADGLEFLCPKCFTANRGPVGTHAIIVWFRGRVPDGAKPGPGRWTPSGRGLADLTLQPSIDLSPGLGCDWHGFVTNGSAK